MNKLTDFIDSLKMLALLMATFATVFALTDARDVNVFYSNYFAGMATGVALLMWAEDID